MEQLIDYVKAFEVYLRGLNKSAYTTKQYSLDAKQFAEIVNDSQSINEALLHYTNMIVERYPSTNSINRKYAAIRQFLSFLQTRGIISSYNTNALQPHDKDEKKLQVLKEKQREKVITYWPHKYEIALSEEDAWLALRNATIVFCIAELGIKPAELVRMEWKHVREDEQQLIVLSSKKYRILYLSKTLVELLKRYREETNAFMLAAHSSPYVWLGVGNQQGQPVTVKTIERVFSAMSEQLGFKITATTLRYAVIKKELNNSTDIDALYEQFGYARKGVLTERQQRFSTEREIKQ